VSDRITALDLLHPAFIDRLAEVVAGVRREGIPLAIFETARTPERQRALFRQGRDPALPDYGRTVTRAAPYQSAHQFGLGADLVFNVNGKWTWDEPEPGMWDRYGAVLREHGLEPLTFERPHAQVAGFQFRQLEPGPADTAAWEQWLRRRVFAQAVG
jgi:peptidoglycan L-alanyl-D-glutamate endopeptidase CwlK